MPVAVKFKVFGTGTNTKTVTDVTLDYVDGPSLPTYTFLGDRYWQKTNQNGTNYEPYEPPVFVRLEEEGKIVEQP